MFIQCNLKGHVGPCLKVKKGEVMSLKLLCERQVAKLRKLETKRYNDYTFTHLQPSTFNTNTHTTERGDEISRKWQLILESPKIYHWPPKKFHNPSSLQYIVLKQIVTDNGHFLRICKMPMPFRIRHELMEWQLLFDMTLRLRYYRRIVLCAAQEKLLITRLHERHWTIYEVLGIWEKNSTQYVGLPEEHLFYHKQFPEMSVKLHTLSDIIQAETSLAKEAASCEVLPLQ